MFHYSSWLEISLPNRMKIANYYGVQKKGSTHVMGDKVISDGYDIKEVEKMLERIYMEFPSDDMKDNILAALDKIEGRDVPIMNLPQKRRRGRPKKPA